MYELSFTLPIDYLQAVREALGVTSAELSDEAIDSVMVLGQAEQEVLKYVPDFATRLQTANTITQNALSIAFINLVCFYVYPSLKLALLYSESDNKTIGTRFRDALTRDPNEFRAKALSTLADQGVDVIGSSPDLLSAVSPATDIITGE